MLNSEPFSQEFLYVLNYWLFGDVNAGLLFSNDSREEQSAAQNECE